MVERNSSRVFSCTSASFCSDGDSSGEEGGGGGKIEGKWREGSRERRGIEGREREDRGEAERIEGREGEGRVESGGINLYWET